MRFINASGKRVTISVPEPKEGLTAGEVKTAMESIIAKNVFTSQGGDLVAVDSARIVNREVTELSVN
nr:DUF2922 domain-containing protein [Desulforadius tongensis]